MWILLLAAWPDSPRETATVVDKIEYNHRFDDQGELQFTQLIFWQWNDRHRRFDVIAWKMAPQLLDAPYKTPQGWAVSWYDSQRREPVTVYAAIFRHTRTAFDPEKDNRELLKSIYRTALLGEVCYARR